MIELDLNLNMAFLYADFYEKKFRVPFCSAITLVWALLFLLAIILPFFGAYSTSSKPLF